MKRLVLFGFLLFALDSMAGPIAGLEIEKCVLAMPGSTHTAAAECGWLSVAENPDKPEGKTIRLRFALVRAMKPRSGSTPVFFFAGGPGQAASELWVQLERPFKKLQKNHDIVLMDQRGTGRASTLSCELDDQTIDLRIDYGKMTDQARECLSKVEGDPRFYTTTIAMSDYEQLRLALEYEKINLMGVSYGTRAALEYLRRYPGQVRSVVLDSMVPVELMLGSEHSLNLDQTVDNILTDCLNDEACAEYFPEVKAQLQQLLEKTRIAPQMLVVNDPLTGDPIELEANIEMLALALRMLSYSSHSQAMLPFLIADAVNTDNPQRLVSQALMVISGMEDVINHWMELSVVCAEDYPFMRPRPQDATTILGEVLYKVLIAQCEVWPRGEVPDDFHQPFKSDVPALLLSGEFDPVTPTRYADQVAKWFSRHNNLVVKGQGHSVAFSECTSAIVTEFITKADPEGLDTSCLEQQGRSPFFINLMGPTP